MSQLRVLVSGASIAGPALAYWLVRAGCKVTLVERAPELRTAGQGIDVRDAARDVVKRMGIFDRMRDKSSHEEGIEFFDSSNRTYARFAVDTSGKGESFSSDVEILRGELAAILFDVTKDDVTYIFGDMVESLQETDEEVNVHFSNGTPTMAFDLVVAADGFGSKIRGMVLGNDSVHVKSLLSYVSYFSIPPNETDTKWSRFHFLSRGRNIFLRPDHLGGTRAFLGFAAHDKLDERLAECEKVSKEGIPAQKAQFQKIFEDADWQGPRVLRGMHDSDDFYMQTIGQIRLKHWSSGRVTFVGDACYAPSPYTGVGTSLAFIGAYILAGEISRQPNNIRAALESYESVLRPYVESIQKLPPGVPWIAHPQSNLAVKALETAVWLASLLSATGLFTLVSKLASLLPAREESFKLPDYEAFRELHSA